MKDCLHLVIPKILLRDRWSTTEQIEARLSAFRADHDISIFRDFPFVMLKEGDRIRTIMDQAFKKARIKPLIKFDMPGALPQQQLCGFRHSRVVYPPVGRGMSPVRRFPFRHHRHRIQQGPLLQQDRRKLHPLMPGKNARSGISHPVSGNSSGNMRNSSGNWNAKSRTRREAHKSHSLRGSSFFFSSSLWYRRKNKPAVKKSMKPRRKPGRLVYS